MSTPFRFKNADNTTVDFEDYYVRADYFRSGNLRGWGNNTFGPLGDNTGVNKSSPVQTIAQGLNWKQISNFGNYHAAAIKTDGTLWCWGLGTSGQLGDNTITSKSSPVQTVTFGTNWVQVACGSGQTAAIKTDGTLWAWGDNATYGALGDNTTTQRNSPVQTVAFGTNWKQVFCGNFQMAAVKTDGTLWAWGYNYYGQLGDNSTANKSSPVQTIAFGNNWKNISTFNCPSALHVACIKTDGTLWMWGANTNGQLGDNTVTKRSSPVQTIAGGTNWKQVSVGIDHTAAIKTDGTLWTWGSNTNGCLGDNTTTQRNSPVQTITFGKNWKQVCTGSTFTAAVKTDGTLWTWGLGTSGQLGDNTITSKSSPVQTIMYGTNWKQVASDGTGRAAAIQYQDDYQ